MWLLFQYNACILGLCDSKKCFITIMMVIITIMMVVYNKDYPDNLLDDINSFWCIFNFKNTKLIAQSLSKISDKSKIE